MYELTGHCKINFVANYCFYYCDYLDEHIWTTFEWTPETSLDRPCERSLVLNKNIKWLYTKWYKRDFLQIYSHVNIKIYIESTDELCGVYSYSIFWQQQIAQEIATKLLYSCAPLRALWCLKNVTIDITHAAKDLPITVEGRAEINNNPQWCVKGSNKDPLSPVSLWQILGYVYNYCFFKYTAYHKRFMKQSLNICFIFPPAITILNIIIIPKMIVIEFWRYIKYHTMHLTCLGNMSKFLLNAFCRCVMGLLVVFF